MYIYIYSMLHGSPTQWGLHHQFLQQKGSFQLSVRTIPPGRSGSYQPWAAPKGVTRERERETQNRTGQNRAMYVID